MRIYKHDTKTAGTIFSMIEGPTSQGKNATHQTVADLIDAGTWRGAVPHRHFAAIVKRVKKAHVRCACGRCQRLAR